MNKLPAEEESSDALVISRVLHGETACYEAIVRRYNGFLYKIGRSYGYNHADTEDLMQETYTEAYLHLKDFQHRAAFKTWITKIMLHQCYHKKQKFSYQREKSIQTDLEENSSLMFHSRPTDTDRIVQNRELKQFLEEAVRHIPEAYRMVFTLRELNGMSINEASDALNISASNVKVRLNRAKAMLRDEIKKIYSPEEIFEFNLIYCEKMVSRVMQAINALPDHPENCRPLSPSK